MTRISRAFRVVGKSIPLLLCVGFAVLVWPTTLGGATSYVKVSGWSMQPKLEHGDLVVTRSDHRYRTGDVIAYRVPEGEVGAGLLVLHRIVGGSAMRGFITRGDNRTVNDHWRPRTADVIGEQWTVVPGAGDVIGGLRNPFALAVFASLLAASAAFAAMRRPRPIRRSPATAPQP